MAGRNMEMLRLGPESLAYLHKSPHHRFHTPTHGIHRAARNISQARSLGRCRPHSHIVLCRCKFFHQRFGICGLSPLVTVCKMRCFANYSCWGWWRKKTSSKKELQNKGWRCCYWWVYCLSIESVSHSVDKTGTHPYLRILISVCLSS